MDLVDIFPATIAVTELKTLTPEIIGKAIAMIDLGDQLGDLDSDGTYTREQHLLDKILFREVRDEILESCMALARAYSHQVKAMAICNSWGNVIGQGQSIRFHRHVNSYISGSFYLTGGTPFSFHNFLGENLFSMQPAIDPGADNPRGQQTFVIRPRPGRLILFPSGLHHSVVPSRDREKRYSVAFNAIPIGTIGTPTNLVTLQAS